jgi:PAS domain S-box-containing protein
MSKRKLIPASGKDASRAGNWIQQGNHGSPTFWRDTLTVLFIALAYFAAHELAFRFPDAGQALMAVWPAGGIGLAALLLNRRQLWPAIITALFVAGSAASLLAGRPLFSSIGFMTANVLESLACAWVILLWRGEGIRFFRVKEIGVLIFVAFAVNAVTALIGAGAASLTDGTPFWGFWQTWWASHGLGILLVTPLITVWTTRRYMPFRMRWFEIIESVLTLVFWCLIVWLAFQVVKVPSLFFSQPYIIVVILAYISLRFGQRGTTLALTVMAVIVISSESVRVGPLLWSDGTFFERLLSAQTFIASLAVTGFLLSSVFLERAQAENTLRDAEWKLRSVFDNMQESFYRTDSEGCFVWVSPSTARILGYESPDELIGRDVAATIYPVPEKRAIFLQALSEKGRVTDYEIVLKRRDDSLITVSTNSSFYYDASGKVAGVEGAFRDISERKRSEELLRESKFQLEVAVQAGNLGLWDRDLQNNKVFFSKDWKGQIGYEENEISDDFSEWQSRVHPEDLDRALATINAYLANPWPNYEIEFRLRHKDGSYRWILARASLLYDNNGKPCRMLGAHIDITERKRMEAILQIRLRLLEYSATHTVHELLVKALDEICSLIESPIGFYHFVEPDQKNLTLQAWSTRTTEEFCKTEGEELHHSVDKAGIWADAIRMHRPVVHNDFASLPNQLPTGHALLIRELIVPILRGGLVVSVLGVGNKAQNYTERDVDIVSTLAGMAWEIVEFKKAQDGLKTYSEKLQEMVEERTHELRQAQEQLVRQERLAVLGQLAGGVGHELRNPLAVMSSAMYFIKLIQPEMDERMKKHIGIIENEVKNADKIISDLLDFSRIKSVDREPVAASELVRRVLERYPVPEHLTVSVEISPDLPPVHVDPRQIVQVLGNLVTNACQAMPEQGSLSIKAEGRGDESQPMVSIAVSDTGTGILPENMDKLFVPLFTTKPRGIGLGLAVCRKLMDANGGRIEVRSEPGKGATFTVHLPVTGTDMNLRTAEMARMD